MDRNTLNKRKRYGILFLYIAEEGKKDSKISGIL
jgi:hypothetical protein